MDKITIRDLKEILIHFQDRKYDEYEVVLWDYNNQQKLSWGGGYALSHPEKELSFPITVPPADGVAVTEKLRKLINEREENKK